MKGNSKQALIWAAAIVVISVLVAWSVYLHLAPKLEINLAAAVTPISKNAATLDAVDIEKILGVEQFRVIKRVEEVPAVIKTSFSNITGQPFDLAEPGEQRSSDMIIPGKSSRRLVFLGVSSDSAVLFFEQGGFVGTFNTVVFWFGDGGRDWGGTLYEGPIPKDIPSLKDAVQKGKFRPWERNEYYREALK
jgi:hypothetical protein